MESHYFTEPIPVKDANALPTWRIEVMRHSVQEAVGTLLVSNENLPPRRTKRKILWKLPDNTSSNPTFGEHEKKRLWELFKQQKKERKRQALLEKGQSGTDDEEISQSNGEKSVLSASTGATTTAPNSQANDNGENGYDEEAYTTSMNNVRRPPEPVTTNTMPAHSEGERSPPLNYEPPPPPPGPSPPPLAPPGFDMAARLRSQPPPPPPGLSTPTTTMPPTPPTITAPPDFSAAPSVLSVAPPGLSVAPSVLSAAPPGLSAAPSVLSVAPPGLSATTTAMPSTTSPTRAAPPGLFAAATSTTRLAAATPSSLSTTKTSMPLTSTTRAALLYAPGSKAVPPVAATSRSRFPTSSTASQQQQQSQPSFFGPARYFRKSPNEPATALAAQVVSTFLHTMTCDTPGVPSTTWLQYYSASTAATKTLLIGSAQAVCRTPQDCLQQVRSLSMPGECTWECHGYTIQPTCTGSSTTAADQSQLIIMTGRTIQKGESLAYNLTLVLKPLTTVAAADNSAVYYQIENDVLSLFAVNVSGSAD